MDKYEASVWEVPSLNNRRLIQKIQQGKATLADLAKGGASQHGANMDDYSPPFGTCEDSGESCAFYAMSLPGVGPSTFITWFQAQAACKNARKRLPSNAEWQAAVLGTPDPGPDDGTTACNTDSAAMAVLTGSRAACVSADGAYDMVGNVEEWVADWVPQSLKCGDWNSISPTFDSQCFLGVVNSEPAALRRGGAYYYGSLAGPLAVDGRVSVSSSADYGGFRCAR